MPFYQKEEKGPHCSSSQPLRIPSASSLMMNRHLNGFKTWILHPKCGCWCPWDPIPAEGSRMGTPGAGDAPSLGLQSHTAPLVPMLRAPWTGVVLVSVDTTQNPIACRGIMSESHPNTRALTWWPWQGAAHPHPSILPFPTHVVLRHFLAGKVQVNSTFWAGQLIELLFMAYIYTDPSLTDPFQKLKMKELILLHSCVTPHEIKMVFYGCVRKQSLAAATLMKMPLESVELGNEEPLNPLHPTCN